MVFNRTPALLAAIAAAAMLAATVAVVAKTVELPENAPRPEVHAPPAGNVPVRLGDTPVPEPRPGQDGDEDKVGAEPVPVPTENPRHTEDGEPNGTAEPATPPAVTVPEESPKQDDAPQKAEPARPPDPRSAIEPAIMMPSAEIACRQRLTGAGVAFKEAPPQSREGGCSLPYPLSVGSLGKSVELDPPAIMNCAMADTMAKFTSTVIQPAAKAEYGKEVAGLQQASAFVCRPRHGTTTLSEHAFGNALDIARFGLEDGTGIDVKPDPDEKAARFLAAVRKAACGPFKTVLGPGADADHALHLHFDLAPRRNGGTFCQ
jgi:hypothetical protein